MKLLYAEDEESMAEAVTDILVFHKYQVDTVYDGEEALEYARNEQYDGMILDIMMPKRSGNMPGGNAPGGNMLGGNASDGNTRQ